MSRIPLWVREYFSSKEYGRAFKHHHHWSKRDADSIDDGHPLWRQYVVFVDLYKYYVEVAWKVSVWYYATTGAILTYLLRHVNDEDSEPLPYVLWFLAFMSVGFAVVMVRGAHNLYDMMKAMDYIATELKLPGRPHVEFAGLFLLGTAFIFTVVGLASAVLFFWSPWSD